MDSPRGTVPAPSGRGFGQLFRRMRRKYQAATLDRVGFGGSEADDTALAGYEYDLSISFRSIKMAPRCAIHFSAMGVCVEFPTQQQL
jgi:hypothetical protein